MATPTTLKRGKTSGDRASTSARGEAGLTFPGMV